MVAEPMTQSPSAPLFRIAGQRAHGVVLLARPASFTALTL
jgi:hypothetical protein